MILNFDDLEEKNQVLFMAHHGWKPFNHDDVEIMVDECARIQTQYGGVEFYIVEAYVFSDKVEVMDVIECDETLYIRKIDVY